MGAIEVAFAGRSNVGKSSLINALTGRNSLARTSHTPGRTQELIFFEGPDKALRLVDMPGYGYAAAPKTKVQSWTELIHKFLLGRASLARVYLLIDARHGLKDVDLDVLKTLDRAAVSYQIVLTKADQVKAGDSTSAARRPAAALAKRPAAFPDVLATSSRSGNGHAGIARGDGAADRGKKLMTRVYRILIALAGVMGADGVILAAASAHQADAARLAAPPPCCCFMPPRFSARSRSPSAASSMRGCGLAAGFGFVVASALFAGDLTLRQYAGHSLFAFGCAGRRHAADRELALLALSPAASRRRGEREGRRPVADEDQQRTTFAPARPRHIG